IAAVARLGNDFYIGTYGAGILRFDAAGRWQAFPDLPPIVVNPNALVAYGDCVYAGSLGQGLWKYSLAANRWTNLVRGLPSSNVTAVAAAGGYVLAGTDNGVIRIPENAL
ncbi:MAG TPA: hypothetical protein VHA11_01170, partial [Bryobacteraceae bacterium]|nr:hypothetical protein [Bryobacteraceae bacterium]